MGYLTTVFLCLILPAAPAFAVLIEADLVSAGDGLVTRDTDTGLEWLDVPLTENQFVDDVEAGFGGYTTIHGFRYALVDEVQTLFENAGVEIRDSFSLNTPTNLLTSSYDEAMSLISLLGETTHAPGFADEVIATLGVTGTPNPENLDVNVFSSLYADTERLAGGADLDSGSGAFSGPFRGHWLVRPIPEPSTALLLGGGLLAIGLRQRHGSA